METPQDLKQLIVAQNKLIDDISNKDISYEAWADECVKLVEAYDKLSVNESSAADAIEANRINEILINIYENM